MYLHYFGERWEVLPLPMIGDRPRHSVRNEIVCVVFLVLCEAERVLVVKIIQDFAHAQVQIVGVRCQKFACDGQSLEV